MSFHNITWFLPNTSVEPISDFGQNSELVTRYNNQNAQLLLPVMSFIGFLLVVGVVGNGLVCYVYYYKIKSTKRTFIIALAILDLVNCLFTMPFEIYDMRNQFNFSSIVICKVFRSLETALVLSAGFTLLAVSIDRYIKICVRNSRIYFTHGRAKMMCWICVLVSILFSWPVLLFAGTEDIHVAAHLSINSTGSECKYFCEKAFSSLNAKLFTFILLAVFIAALIIMCVSYCMIGAKLYNRRRGSFNDGLVYLRNAGESHFLRTASDNNAEPCGYAIGRHGIRVKGSTVIFFSVTFVFVIGFLPHLVVRILRFANIAFHDTTTMDADEVLYNFLIRSFMINNAANPFIYSIFHKRFRQDVVKTFRRLNPSSCCRKTR